MKQRLVGFSRSLATKCQVGSWALLFVLVPVAVQAVFEESAYQMYAGKPVVAIAFKGNSSTREHVIARELEVAVGDTLNLENLAEGYQNLENLGIFGSIQIVATEEGDGVSLEYRFKEMPPFIPYVAFRYTEENGFSVGPALSSVNLFGRAIRVSGRALFGGTTTFALTASYPWITGDYHLGVDLTANHLVRDDELTQFEETSDEITPVVKRHVGDKGRARGMVGYFRMKADKDGIALSPDRSDQFFRFGAAVGYDSRDSWRDPRSGWENEIELIGTFGDGDYGTATIDIRRFQRVSEKQTLFIGALTSLQSGTVGEDVPVYFQYRLGGANSIRGQDVDLGKTLYGKNQLLTVLEYHMNIFPLKPYNFFKWSAAIGLQLALFADTGVAWSDPEDLSTGRFKTGYGVGLRLLVPGSEAARFDVGFNGQGDVRFHFANWFRWTAQRFRLR